ncbi:MAG: hypothetical protein R3A47_02010 [Polyangiales bacterium]
MNGWQMPPSVLMVPAGAAPQQSSVGSGLQRAQEAAVAQELVRSLRIGNVGKNGKLVQLRLNGASKNSEIEVELRSEGGTIVATLRGDALSQFDAQRLAERFEREARQRGLKIDAINVEQS